MKAKDIVAQITEGPEYCMLVKFGGSGNIDTRELPSKIVKAVHVLDKRIDKRKKSFLRNSGLKPREPRTNIIDFRVPPDVNDAKDEFDKQLKKQMPIFIELMNSIPAENLILESIAI